MRAFIPSFTYIDTYIHTYIHTRAHTHIHLHGEWWAGAALCSECILRLLGRPTSRSQPSPGLLRHAWRTVRPTPATHCHVTRTPLRGQLIPARPQPPAGLAAERLDLLALTWPAAATIQGASDSLLVVTGPRPELHGLRSGVRNQCVQRFAPARQQHQRAPNKHVHAIWWSRPTLPTLRRPPGISWCLCFLNSAVTPQSWLRQLAFVRADILRVLPESCRSEPGQSFGPPKRVDPS
jgi:hypothetical protein